MVKDGALLLQRSPHAKTRGDRYMLLEIERRKDKSPCRQPFNADLRSLPKCKKKSRRKAEAETGRSITNTKKS